MMTKFIYIAFLLISIIGSILTIVFTWAGIALPLMVFFVLGLIGLLNLINFRTSESFPSRRIYNTVAIGLAVVSLIIMGLLLNWLIREYSLFKETDNFSLAAPIVALFLFVFSVIINTTLYRLLLSWSQPKPIKIILGILVFCSSIIWFLPFYNFNPTNKIAAKKDPTILWAQVTKDADYAQPFNNAYKFSIKYPGYEQGWTMGCPGQKSNVVSKSGYCYLANQQSWYRQHERENPVIPENLPNLCYFKITYPFQNIQGAVTTINNISDPKQKKECDDTLSLMKTTLKHTPI